MSASFIVTASDGRGGTAPETVTVPISAAAPSVAVIKNVLAPAQMAVTPDGKTLYVADVTSNGTSVTVIDTATNAVTGTIHVGVEPEGVALNPDGSRLYGTNEEVVTVSVVDTATNKVIATVTVGSDPRGVVVSDTATGKTLGSLIAVGPTPIGIAIIPNGTRVYVANFNSNTVSVIDTATSTVVDSIPIGHDPQYVAVSPDGSQVYVGVEGDSAVDVITGL